MDPQAEGQPEHELGFARCANFVCTLSMSILRLIPHPLGASLGRDDLQHVAQCCRQQSAPRSAALCSHAVAAAACWWIEWQGGPGPVRARYLPSFKSTVAQNDSSRACTGCRAGRAPGHVLRPAPPGWAMPGIAPKRGSTPATRGVEARDSAARDHGGGARRPPRRPSWQQHLAASRRPAGGYCGDWGDARSSSYSSVRALTCGGGPVCTAALDDAACPRPSPCDSSDSRVQPALNPCPRCCSGSGLAGHWGQRKKLPHQNSPPAHQRSCKDPAGSRRLPASFPQRRSSR